MLRDVVGPSDPSLQSEVTEEEYYASGEDSDWELLDGRKVVSPASEHHEDLFRFLLTLLSAFLDERGGAVVRGSRYPMRLDARWSPEPDLFVVLDEHRDRLLRSRLEGPADLVIEIASDSDPKFDPRVKLPRYRQAEIPEIWCIDPFERIVRTEVLMPKGYASSVLSSGRLESRIVPGFWIEAGWLWSDPLPSTLACLRQILG